MTVPAHFVADFLSDEDFQNIFGEGEEARIYAATSLGQEGVPEKPEKPYLVWNELPSTPLEAVAETSNAEWRFFTFHAYDDMGRIDRINQGLFIVRRRVKAMATFRAADGTFCMATKWQGFSGVFNDREYDATVRFGTARFDVSQ